MLHASKAVVSLRKDQESPSLKLERTPADHGTTRKLVDLMSFPLSKRDDIAIVWDKVHVSEPVASSMQGS